MALDPLKNPMERLKSLPTGMSWRKNPTDNSPYWDAALQYYSNDVVLSTVDEGAYVMTGAGASLAEAQTAVRGGDDPSTDSANWTALAPSGVGKANWSSPAISAVTVGAGTTTGALTITGGALTRPAGGLLVAEKWLVTLTGGLTGAAGGAFGDALTVSFAPAVAGTTVSVDCVLAVGANSFSASAVVTLGVGSTGCGLAASWATTAAAPSAPANFVVTWIRVA
jgi:hypothetical protein